MVDRTGFFQIAFVVDDLDRAMDAWVAEGVGPFYVQREPKVENVRHFGAEIDFRFSVAYAQSGGVQIELISQRGDEPSYYRDVYAAGEGGFHHMCRFAKDFDAEVAEYGRRGIAIAGLGSSGTLRFAYVDTRPQIGMMTELIEDPPFLRALFDLVSASSKDWDGSSPVRELEFGFRNGAVTMDWRPRS